jgi:hypothetical protein
MEVHLTMETKTALSMNRSCNILLALLFLIGLVTISSGRAQTQSPSPIDKAKVRERIATIMSETLKRGEFTSPEGWKGVTRVPPSKEDTEEIKRYGDDAVPILEEYLSSEVGREYELAMRFLGALGGHRIIEPLRKIILFDPSPRKREFALYWITQAPWDEASPILRQAADADPDSSVREAAKDMLTNYAPQ